VEATACHNIVDPFEDTERTHQPRSDRMHHKCHNIVDPFEDTERQSKSPRQSTGGGCHNIVDPFEDTESFNFLNDIAISIAVTTSSIRSRILKARGENEL